MQMFGRYRKGISGTGHLIHIRDWLFDPTYHLSYPRDSSAKEEDVINAAKDIYRNYPEILKALGL